MNEELKKALKFAEEVLGVEYITIELYSDGSGTLKDVSSDRYDDLHLLSIDPEPAPEIQILEYVESKR